MSSIVYDAIVVIAAVLVGALAGFVVGWLTDTPFEKDDER